MSDKGKRKRRNLQEWVKNKKRVSAEIVLKLVENLMYCAIIIMNHCCKASTLKSEDIDDFFFELNKNDTAVTQNAYLMNFMVPYTPKTSRSRKAESRTETSIQYAVRRKNRESTIICAKTFHSITQIERKHVERVAKFFFNTGRMHKKNRGGWRVNEDDIAQTNSIINHIQSLHCRENHYGRSKSV